MDRDFTTLVDASIGWTAPTRRFDVQFWVKNLTDAYYYTGTQASTNYASLPGAPRTFGATLGFHYF